MTGTKTTSERGFSSVLPMPLGEHQGAQFRRYISSQAEVILKGLVVELRQSKLTYERAVVDLSRIAAYYDLMAEVERGLRSTEAR